MRLKPLFLTTLLATGANLMAGDFDQLMDLIKRAMPGKTTGAVACNLETNKDVLRDLAATAHNRGLTLRFFNVTSGEQANTVSGTLKGANPDFVILIDRDPVLGAAGSNTKSFASFLSSSGIPSFSTDEAAIKLGATLAVGPKTQGKVVPNGNKPKALGVKL